MLKISLLVFHEDYQKFLERLRDMGVVHINANNERSAQDELLQEKLRLAKRVDDLIRALDAVPCDTTDVTPVAVSENGEELLSSIEAKFHRKEQIASEKLYLQKDLSIYEPWGEIPSERIGKLKDAGWNIAFYCVAERAFNEAWYEEFNAIQIAVDKGNVYFITLTSLGSDKLAGVDEYLFPEKSAAAIRKEIKQLDDEDSSIDNFFATSREDAKLKLGEFQQQIYGVTDICKVQDATEAILEGKVQFIEGWIPAEKETSLRNALSASSVSFEISRPQPGDDIPVKLKNNAFAKLFEPITEMFALPQYEELDPTPFFAPFFMLFFGLCLGDGGYGLIICLICALLLKKAAPSVKGLLKLGMVLGVATVFVGILTGCFFGIALDEVTWPWLKGVKDYFVTDNNYKSSLGGYSPMMVFAVVIGLVQIFFGMIVSAMKAIKQFGIRYAWSTLGWVIGLITTAVTFGLPAFGVVIPTVVGYVLYSIIGVCVFAIVFLNSPGKNVFVNIGSSLWSAYNMTTGLLGDTLSYIRLFALGLTGSILGSVFNTLAFELTGDLSAAVRWLAVLLILLFGHSINFGLCMIGAFVHPLRLTFVEFYKNANFDGGGKKYEPLKNRISKD